MSITSRSVIFIFFFFLFVHWHFMKLGEQLCSRTSFVCSLISQRQRQISKGQVSCMLTQYKNLTFKTECFVLPIKRQDSFVFTPKVSHFQSTDIYTGLRVCWTRVATSYYCRYLCWHNKIGLPSGLSCYLVFGPFYPIPFHLFSSLFSSLPAAHQRHPLPPPKKKEREGAVITVNNHLGTEKRYVHITCCFNICNQRATNSLANQMTRIGTTWPF